MSELTARMAILCDVVIWAKSGYFDERTSWAQKLKLRTHFVVMQVSFLFGVSVK